MNLLHRTRAERGAVLVHAAVIIVAFMAFTAFVFDQGVMLVSRGQAQNSADAGALAGAVSLAFAAPDDIALAQNSALNAAQQNQVWGEVPGTEAFVADGQCPADSGSSLPCVRVNARRTSYEGGGGTPLPTFFANIVGISEQGTRAMAIARVLDRAGTADSVKPWAIPDKWTELNQLPFNPLLAAFNEIAAPPDQYTAPNPGGPGTGFALPTATPNDYGVMLTLRTIVTPPAPATREGYIPVAIDSPAPPYQDAIEQPSIAQIFPGMGTSLTYDASANPTATWNGVTTLIQGDPDAFWNPAANGGRGAPSGGCMAAGTCARSPRLVAIPVFDPRNYANPMDGRIIVRNVIGFWIDSVDAGGAITGYITYYPTTSVIGPRFANSSFVRTVTLVR